MGEEGVEYGRGRERRGRKRGGRGGRRRRRRRNLSCWVERSVMEVLTLIHNTATRDTRDLQTLPIGKWVCKLV